MLVLRSQLPSNVSLFAFEAAARHASFTRAAGELNVTQPAVSAAIAKLERFLETKLFRRQGGKLQLTEAGTHLYRAVGSSFQRIEAAITDIRAHPDGKQPLLLSVSSAMTAHWFVPRLPEFQRRFPDVELKFSLIPGEPRGRVDDFDLAMRLDSLLEGDADAIPFVDEQIYAVCSPSYLRQYGPLGTDQEHTLVSLMGQRITWSEFLDRVGITGNLPGRPLTFSDYSIVIHAAASGQGIALGWASVVMHLLASGIMVTACSSVLTTGRQYCLAIPRGRSRRITEEVRDWMIQMIREDLAECRRIGALELVGR